MAKRGRKKYKHRKGYFYEEQEEAVVKYLNTDSQEVKEKIFYDILYPAFSKMIESIINRYKLYPPDEIFEETFNDTMSFLMTKISKFKPDSGYKAYSYCGTICKNYLIYKINTFKKNQKRVLPYDTVSTDIKESLKYSYEEDKDLEPSFNKELIKKISNEINTIIESDKNIKKNEIKVGKALIDVLNNWEELFLQMGSNKFNKSSFLLFLRETTLLDTKEIRDALKKYKEIYYLLKKKTLNDGKI